MQKCSGSGIKSSETFLFQWRVNGLKAVCCAVFKFQSFQIILFKGTTFGTEKKRYKALFKSLRHNTKTLNLLNKASKNMHVFSSQKWQAGQVTFTDFGTEAVRVFLVGGGK